MSYPRTHVDHRDPDHHEAIHPVRNIGNAHVVAGKFLTSQYHEAFQNVLHPLGESLNTQDLHALNDLGVVHVDGSLNELSPIVQTYVRLDDYWTRTHRTALNELFAERRSHIIGCCTRNFISEFSRRTLEVESGRSGAALDATLAPLLDNEFLSVPEDEVGDYTVDEHHALYRPTEQLFDALLEQAPVLCDLIPPTDL
ncbi:hypothetical protein [Natrinema caseinilyticum]|uniref:hypothetical protein n=1 Tax=Natrinema caseinilyticum TaxID=2961570 RepID=UPI0020C27F5A|nr:hypothetical protein [Natrinema caseinilyticum]